jgi:hypothetical protein
MLGIDYGADGFADELTGALGLDGAVYVHGMGTSDATLLEVAGELGEIIAPGVGMPSGAHDGRIYTVEVRNQRIPPTYGYARRQRCRPASQQSRSERH